MKSRSQKHFSEHIKTIVACGAVRAQAYVDAAVLKLLQGCDSACQLEIACGTAHNGYVMLFERAYIVARRMHAVIRYTAVIEKPQFCKINRRRFAVPCHALLDFLSGFAEVGINRHLVRLGKLRHSLYIFFAVGILGVKSQTVFDKTSHLSHSIHTPFKAFEQLILRSVALGNAFEYYVAKTALLARLGYTVEMEVHIACKAYTARDVFGYRKFCQPVTIVRSKLCFAGKDLRIKPFVERGIVGKRAQKYHRRMSVRVFERRHNEIALGVYLSVPRQIYQRADLTDKTDFSVFNPQLAVFDIVLARPYSRIVNSNQHIISNP